VGAAVDLQDGTGDGPGEWAGEVTHGVGDLFWGDKAPVGCRPRSAARAASGSSAAASNRWTHGVSAVPGATAFTLMPSRTRSAAIARTSACSAPLLALYAARWTKPVQPGTEPVHTTAARPVGADRRRWGGAARTRRAVPTRLTSRTRCHSSSVTSLTPPVEPMPALETTTSRPPSRSATSATASRTKGSLPTSQGISSMCSSGSASGCRSRDATAAPRARNARTVARPIPLAPPVTRARTPSNSEELGPVDVADVRDGGHARSSSCYRWLSSIHHAARDHRALTADHDRDARMAR
jgi:hypothetical protein